MMAATGKCLCGAVRFSAEDPSTEVHACHCRMCQHWVGGPALGLEVESVTFEGSENIETYPSSEWAERGFCKICGSNLFYRLKAQNRYILFAGSFDEPSGFRLAGEIFVDEKLRGIDFAGKHNRLTGEEFWASIQQE